MDSFLRVLLTNALLAGLLALAAWAASRFVRRQAVVHGLWLLALVKLVTPPLVELPLLPAPARHALPSAVRVEPAPAESREAPAAVPLGEPGAGASVPGLRAAAASPRPAAAAPAWRFAFLCAVLLGAAAVAGLTAIRFVRFRRVVSLSAGAPGPLAERVAELAGSLGVAPPPLFLVAARVSPMLWPAPSGPQLLLPRDLLPELSDGERDALLAHELAHVRRRDHWVRLLETAATALFWWYPVAWWARRALRRAEERCCDEWVLRALPDSAVPYANGILKSLTFLAGAPDPLPAAASGAGRIEDLESRLKEILMTHPLPRLSRPVRLGLGAAAVVGLALFPTLAPPRSAEASAAVALPGTDVPPPPAAAPAAAPAPSARPPSAAPPAPAAAPIPVAPPHPVLVRDGEDPEPALEAERRALQAERRKLHLSELELERRSLELEAKAQSREYAAEAARLRAAGELEAAERAGKLGEMSTRRLDLERRRLDLQANEVKLEAEMDRLASQAGAGSGRQALEAEQELERLGQALESEVEELDREMRALEAEVRLDELRGATDELARSLSEQIASLREDLPEAGARRADLEREIGRLEAARGALDGGGAKSRTPRPSPPPQK